MPKTIQIIALAGCLLGLLPVTGAASDPADLPTEAAAPAARDLVAARQANARAQREGRPSVWMAKPAPAPRQGGERGGETTTPTE